MSTPYPLEERTQLDPGQALADPWSGPIPPRWYSGLGFSEDTAYLGPFYRVLEGFGQGAAKGEALLAGLAHTPLTPDVSEMRAAGLTEEQIRGAERQAEEQQQRSADQIEADAQQRVKAMTPDPTTTGAAAQTINGLASGLSRFTTGSLIAGPLGGAAAVGGTEAASRYQELREEGVDQGTAGASAGLAGVTSAAGAFIPGGFGSNLLTRVLTGAGANAGFGLGNRYLDHQILENGGYKEMADQQRVWDGTQFLIDSVLGAGFGGLAHLHARSEETSGTATAAGTPAPREVPGAEDAALTANLALRDRAAAPGVPVDPAAAAAHQAAMEKATSDLLQGKPVDVSSTGVDQADFARRPAPDVTEPERMLVNVLKESGILDEEQNLRELEMALERRQGGEPEPAAPRRESVQTPAESSATEPRTTFTTAKGSTYEVTENGTTIRNKAARPEHPGESGPQPESERTFYVTPEDAEKLGEFQTQGGVAKSVNLVDEGRAGVRYEEGPGTGKFERRTVVNVQHEPAEGLVPVETWKNGRRVHFGNAITEVRRPESVTSETHPAEEGYTVGEQELTDEQRQAFERLAHPQDQELQTALERGGEPGQRGPEDDGGRGELGRPGEPTRVYRGGRGGPLTPEHFSPETLGRATGHPSSGLGVYFTSDASDAARYGAVTEHDLTLKNPKRVPIEDLPGFDTRAEATAYREQLRAEGHDGMVIDASHLGGPKHFVVFEPGGVKPVGTDPTTQMTAEHPGMQIPDESGRLQGAGDAVQQADAAAAKGEQEAPKATEAAVNCFLRKGS